MKEGVEFEFDGYYSWFIYAKGECISHSMHDFSTLDEAEQNLRSICQILYPYTIENKTVTEAIVEFKKKQK